MQRFDPRAFARRRALISPSSPRAPAKTRPKYPLPILDDYSVNPALLIMLVDQSIMGTSVHHVLMLIRVSLCYEARNQESVFITLNLL